jgi:RNA polymerase sigma factor (TIGR02999 family)
MGELTALLAAVRAGQPGAVDALVALTYKEIHDLAHRRLRQNAAITLLDTTSLVHECYLRLVQLGEIQVADRTHFIAYAARAMRSIVIDLARRRRAERHGGGVPDLTVDTNVSDGQNAEEVIRVDEALVELATIDTRLAELVELKYFGGLTHEEIAQLQGVNERTVRRDWEKARLFLHRELTR